MSGYRTDIEAFNLYGDNGSVTYERDHDLEYGVMSARRGGTVAGLVLIELGIDGYKTHQVRLDFGVVDREPGIFDYAPGGDEVRAFTDAIEALTTVRDRLATLVASA